MASPSASVLSVVTSQKRSSPLMGSLGSMVTTGAPGGVLRTVRVVLVAVAVSVPSLTLTTTETGLTTWTRPTDQAWLPLRTAR